jgi:hypothetical protein
MSSGTIRHSFIYTVELAYYFVKKLTFCVVITGEYIVTVNSEEYDAIGDMSDKQVSLYPGSTEYTRTIAVKRTESKILI